MTLSAWVSFWIKGIGKQAQEKNKRIQYYKEPKEVIMNCLFLLIILFCCGSNGNYGGNCRRGNSGCAVRENSCNRRDDRRDHDCDGMGSRREYDCDRRDYDCDCDATPAIHSCPASNTVSRTQFPYLDVEPRTCGCEEKSNS